MDEIRNDYNNDDNNDNNNNNDDDNNHNYETSWKIIAEKVMQILHRESKGKMIFEPLYTKVYRNVCDGYSERMHIDLITICSRHLNEINAQLCPPEELSVGHLWSISNHMKDYLLSIRNITSIFSYLNKFYVSYYLNMDLFVQLSGLFNQIIIMHRLPNLMYIVEESLKVPFSFPPGILHKFFNELQQISNGEYSSKYPHLFSRYCLNVFPAMKESDLEGHIAEVREFQQKLRNTQSMVQTNHGIKRPAEDEEMERRFYYQNRQIKGVQTFY